MEPLRAGTWRGTENPQVPVRRPDGQLRLVRTGTQSRRYGEPFSGSVSSQIREEKRDRRDWPARKDFL